MSEAPCGDAAIFELSQIDNDFSSSPKHKSSSDSGNQMNFSGAKLIVSNSQQEQGNLVVEVLREPKEQTLGALRLKSGRSDIE